MPQVPYIRILPPMQTISTLRKSFPVYARESGLVYLDTAASSLVPAPVIEKLRECYEEYPVNVARGLYGLSERASEEFETAREKTARFLHAETEEIVFTKNTTESFNLLARTILPQLPEGSEIAITAMEHHANFVPWQQLAKRHGVKFIVIPFEEDGTLSPETIAKHLSSKTKLLSFVHISNVFGCINPAKVIIEAARAVNPDIITVLDAAQSAAHMPINVRDLDCDFLAFSSHKCFGPTGAGVLCGKRNRLEALTPFLYGGLMIESVSDTESTFREIPYRFEAGTPAVGEVIGMGAAIDFIEAIDRQKLLQHEEHLTKYTWKQLQEVFGDRIRLLGPDPENHPHAGVISLTLDGIHPHDISQILAEENICVRAGAHCAMPLHRAVDIAYHSSLRASFSIYNDESDVDRFVEGLRKADELFSR